MGLAYDSGPWTFAFDYLWIDWSREKALANSLTQGGAPGASDGPGFGWRDQHVFRFGVSYHYSERLQLPYMYDFRHITKGKGASAGVEAGGELHMLTVGLGYRF